MQLTRLPRDTEPQRGYHKHTSRTFRGQYRGSRKTRPLDSALFLPAIKPTHPLTPTPAAPSTPNIYYDFKPSAGESSYGAPVADPISDSYGNPATPVYVGSTTPVYVASTTPGPISYVTSSPQPSYTGVGDTVKTTAIYRSETGKKFQPGTVYQEPKKV